MIELEAPRKRIEFSTEKKPLAINILSETDDEIEFDLFNVEPCFANALRRIMIAEVRTVAIEFVNIYINKSVMQDEVLAHRLGLIPIYIDPESLSKNDEVKFKLHVKHDIKSKEDRKIYSGDLNIITPSPKFQENLMPKDILITILVPGEEIELECTCIAGVGADHSKFSPVATAFYKNVPKIDILDNSATELVQVAPKVFGEKNGRVFVKDARQCTLSRECLKVKDKKGNPVVKIERDMSHYHFCVESVGSLPPREIVKRAIKVLKRKCSNILNNK